MSGVVGPEEARRLAEQLRSDPGVDKDGKRKYYGYSPSQFDIRVADAVLFLCEQVERLEQSREHHAADALRYKHDLAQGKGRPDNRYGYPYEYGPPDDERPDYRCGCSVYWYQRAETAEAALVERDAEIQRLREQVERWRLVERTSRQTK